MPKASFNYKTVFSNTSGLVAYRGPWQFETLAREILLDIAARKMGIDPVELRRRNLLRGDEMPYINPNGMPYDHVAPADTFEQAVKILDHEGFRKEQADALAQGRYIGLGFSAYIEPTGAAIGDLGTEGATIRIEPTGKINVYVNGGSSGNSIETTVVQLTADALGADIDDVADDPGRHGGDPVRSRHPGQPQRPDDGRRRQRGRCDAAQADRRDGGAPAGRGRSRHRARAAPRQRPRRPVEERELRRPRLPRVLRAASATARDVGVAGGHRAVHVPDT